jgi:hypothetical protein
VFKITKTSRILKVCPETDVPLVLQNSDIIRRDKLLRRLGSSGGEDCGSTSTGSEGSAKKRRRKGGAGDSAYQALDDFRLVAGEIQDQQVRYYLRPHGTLTFPPRPLVTYIV